MSIISTELHRHFYASYNVKKIQALIGSQVPFEILQGFMASVYNHHEGSIEFFRLSIEDRLFRMNQQVARRYVNELRRLQQEKVVDALDRAAPNRGIDMTAPEKAVGKKGRLHSSGAAQKVYDIMFDS